MDQSDLELESEYMARFGDPRRCPVHGCVTSSGDGLHDAPCPMCEASMEEEEEQPTVTDDLTF